MKMTEKLRVFQQTKYGVVVWTSEAGEQGRKDGCLCTNACKRMANNIAWEKEQIKKIMQANPDTITTEEQAKEMFRDGIIIAGQEEYVDLTNGVPFPTGKNERCPIATTLFGLCLATNQAIAVTRCPYLEPDETRVIIIKENEAQLKLALNGETKEG